MNDLAQLLVDCDRHGIRLAADGTDGLAVDSPQDALTPALMERLKAHKPELMAILRHQSDAPRIDLTHAPAVWQAALDRLEGDPLFPPTVMEALRAANAQWVDEPTSAIVAPDDEHTAFDVTSVPGTTQWTVTPTTEGLAWDDAHEPLF